MKHLLLILLMLPATVSAKKIQLGLNAGPQYNAPMAYLKNSRDEGRINGYISARAFKDVWRLQLGITVDAGRITTVSMFDTYTDETFTESRQPINITAGVYVAPTIILNYKVRIAKGYAYAGLAAGYTRSFEDKSADGRWVEVYEPGISPHSDYDYVMVGRKFSNPSSNWIALGAQVGYTLQLTGKWGVNAEAAVRLMEEERLNSFSSGEALYFPISLGVRYTL